MTPIAVFTAARQTRRQVARALYSGAFKPSFVESARELEEILKQEPIDLVVVDCDQPNTGELEQVITAIHSSKKTPSVILLSTGGNKQPLLELARDRDICNVVAKHGAIRAVFPMMDERELLVTCEKVLKRNIFGIEKYVGSWGVVCRQHKLKSLPEKAEVLDAFGEFLNGLDCPNSIIAAILTVADELIMNAVIHGPHLPDGTPKYEAVGPTIDMVLDPNEYVDINYGCDGQRLMLSVADNFGRLTKHRLYGYLVRSFGEKQEVESRPSGAGLGLSMAFKNLHQLIINVEEHVRTEAIAGWYLRSFSGAEFRQVAKSFNVFWLAQSEGAKKAEPVLPPPAAAAAPALTYRLKGQIDERIDFSEAKNCEVLDLRDVTRITSRGVLVWLTYVGAMKGKGLRLKAVPEAMVRVAADVAGILDGVTVSTVMAPFECPSCSDETDFEVALNEAVTSHQQNCPRCGKEMKFASLIDHYQAVAKAAASRSA